MFDVGQIQSGLVGLVGVQQPYNPTYAVFDAQNLTSESGLYLNDMPYFKAEYLIDSALGSDYTPTQVNESLINIFKGANVDVCNRVFDKIDLIDRQIIFTKAQNKVNLETTLNNGFLGYRIRMSNQKDLAFKINKLILEFQGAGDVKIMLFNSYESAPVKETTVTISSNYQTEEVNWIVNNTTTYKGEYYIGFVYDGTLTPYKRDYRDASYENSIKELTIDKVQVNGHITEDLFDLEDVEGLSENNGLNLDVTVFEDFTDFILNNKFLFARAIQLSSSINIYNRFISSNASNKQERYSKELILSIMRLVKGTRGDGFKEGGLETMLDTSIVGIKREIEKLRENKNGGNQILVGTLY